MVAQLRDARVARVQRGIGVRKIKKIRVGRNAFEQFAGPDTANLVPSHVGQTAGRRQRGNILGEQAQARVAGRFIAGREHGLQPQANS